MFSELYHLLSVDNISLVKLKRIFKNYHVKRILNQYFLDRHKKVGSHIYYGHGKNTWTAHGKREVESTDQLWAICNVCNI